MNISYDNSKKVSGVLTVSMEKADYQERVDKSLKSFRKKANVPGFRPGQVPMALIKKQVGLSVVAEEVNKLLGEKIYDYIKENKIQMLGEPLPNDEKQKQIDFEKDESFDFVFDIALAPEFKAELTDKDKVDYYKITVDDKLIDQQIEMFASRAGKYDKVDSYQDKDMLKGNLSELDENGGTKETGVVVNDAVMMPDYMKDEAQKALFKDAKVGDVITFNPFKAYEGNEAEISSLLKIKKEEVAEMKSDFSYQVGEITRFKKAEVNQELFDQIYGEGVVKDEADFRKKIAEGLSQQLANDSDYKFLLDVRAYLEKKVGKLEFADDLMKKIMQNGNKDKDQEYIDKNYDGAIKDLVWHLIKEQLVSANNIKVEDADVKNAAKEATRAQFAQYGMSNIPDDVLENYSKQMLEKKETVEGLVDRCIDAKLTAILKNVVKLNEKSITLDEFNKLMA
jgi:trigger factor